MTDSGIREVIKSCLMNRKNTNFTRASCGGYVGYWEGNQIVVSKIVKRVNPAELIVMEADLE